MSERSTLVELSLAIRLRDR